jgi:hypothetical protein
LHSRRSETTASQRTELTADVVAGELAIP